MTTPEQAIIGLRHSKRIVIVDILRGYALLGVVVINYTFFIDSPEKNRSYIDTATALLANWVFFRKSALLLSVLFGYGFSVLISNLQSKGQHVVTFFIKRMFWLFVIAIINSCFFDDDILKSYALLGLILLLFYSSSTKTILIFSIILLLLIPLSSSYTLNFMSDEALVASHNLHHLYLSHHFTDVIQYNIVASFVLQATWPFYAISVQHIMLCCFLWGMYAHRLHFFENIHSNKKYIKRIFWFSIPAFALSTVITQAEKKIHFLADYYDLFIISFLCAMLFFSSALMLLYVSGKLKRIFKGLECYGKMTLTNYLGQNLIAFFVFSGVGLNVGGNKPYWVYFSLSIFVYVVQLFLSNYWLKNYHYGPVEWLWRQLNSKTKLPFKIIR